MKNLFVLVVVSVLFTGTSYGYVFTKNSFLEFKTYHVNQDTTKSKEFKKGIDGMIEMAGKGKRIFVECADSVILEYAHEALNKWKYWKIVKEKEQADFTLQIKEKEGKGLKWEIYAVFVSSAGKEVYKTKPSQKFGVGKLKARETSTNYLIENIIRPFFDL